MAGDVSSHKGPAYLSQRSCDPKPPCKVRSTQQNELINRIRESVSNLKDDSDDMPQDLRWVQLEEYHNPASLASQHVRQVTSLKGYIASPFTVHT